MEMSSPCTECVLRMCFTSTDTFSKDMKLHQGAEREQNGAFST